MVDVMYKIVILGSEHSGKTSMLYKYTNNSFKVKYDSTIGVNYNSKTVIMDDGINAKLQLWDTSGQKRFRPLIQAYYNRVDGLILMFDLTDVDSFKQLNEFMHDIRHKNDVPIVLVGNKNDVVDKKVSQQDIDNFMKKSPINMYYFETSAYTGFGIHEMFIFLSKEIHDSKKDTYDNNKESNIDSTCIVS